MTEIQRSYIPLDGLTSEHDALIIEAALRKITGLQEYRVEFNNHRLWYFSTDSSIITTVIETIRQLGYKVPTLTQTLPVTGMVCAGCAASVQEAVEPLPGVLRADASYANSSLQIEYIPNSVSPEKLKATLQDHGYDLLLENASDDSQSMLETYQKQHFNTLRKKTIGALLFTIPLVIIGMTPQLMHHPIANWVMWALSTPIVFFFGKQFFIGAYKQAKHGSMNMDTLVALSTSVAYLFSVFNTLFPHFWHSKDLHAHVYFEAAAVIITFILLGKLLEEKAKGNTASAIRKLIGLQPKTVETVREDGTTETLPIEKVAIGTVIVVRPGERVAVDGKVIQGSSYVDESMLTGEPIPVIKTIDKKVFSGTINQKGSFQFIAEKVGNDTLLAQIIQAVKDAQGSKAPVQKLVDQIAKVFVPIVISLALICFIAWYWLAPENNIPHAILALVTVLIIACPCALGLATPTAIMVGIGKAAEKGILIKDAESLEIARKVDTVILDKTGTITEGKPQVESIHWFHPQTTELTNILFSIEKQSEHPLAEAIATFLTPNAQLIPNLKIENEIGKGIRGIIHNTTYVIGNRQLIENQGIHIDSSVEQIYEAEESKARTVVLFCNADKPLACISISDKIKQTSFQAISDLQNNNIEVIMLTGDNPKSAAIVAKTVGINTYKAQTLPEDKSNYIKALQAQGRTVAMVGDGINDSNALAQADVSIAMGKGSDIAMDVAKMTLISGDLRKIAQAIQLSKQTVSTVQQNLFWAFIYNIIGIPIAAGILYPINGFLLDPMLAGGAMALSSVSVVLNSLRLKLK